VFLTTTDIQGITDTRWPPFGRTTGVC